MSKYPVLRNLSGLARFIGLVGLILGVIIIFVGIVVTLSAISSISQYQGAIGVFGLYSGFVIISGGVALLIASIYLIIVGEVIDVFLDIESNTFETANLLASLVGNRSPTQRPPGDITHMDHEPSNTFNLQPIPTGFGAGRRRIEVGDEVFHPIEGVGVATRPGRNRHFIWIRFQDAQQEKEMERFGLFQR